MDDEVLVERRGGVAWVTLNRPAKLNALNAALRAQLERTAGELDADDGVKVIVLTGAGRAFSAGADLNEVHRRDLITRRRQTQRDPSHVVRELQKPVIAMIDGYAVGGGLEIALACDIRVASETARFSFPEVRHGWIPGAGGTQTLPRVVGSGQAAMMIFTGRQLDARSALEIGLVDAVHESARLREATAELAEEIARHRLPALILAKAGLRAAASTPLPVGLQYERELSAIAYSFEGKEEAVAAFLERRDPAFED